jgi:hypothetical protein
MVVLFVMVVSIMMAIRVMVNQMLMTFILSAMLLIWVRLYFVFKL